MLGVLGVANILMPDSVLMRCSGCRCSDGGCSGCGEHPHARLCSHDDRHFLLHGVFGVQGECVPVNIELT